MRERLRGQLMIALYRCGRQADALETYRAGRSLLVEELAVEPGPQLRKLQLAVLEQDAALDLRPPAGQAGHQGTRGRPCGRGRPADQAVPEPRAGTPSLPRRRGRTRRIALALGTAAALAAVALVPLSRHGTVPASLNANLLALVSPSDGTVQATVPLRAPPADVAAGSGSLWVAEPDAGLVARVDPVAAHGRRHHPGRHQAQPRRGRGRPGLGARPGRPHPGPDRPADRHGGADDRPGRPAERRPAQRGHAVGRQPGRRDGAADRPRHRPHRGRGQHGREPERPGRRGRRGLGGDRRLGLSSPGSTPGPAR